MSVTLVSALALCVSVQALRVEVGSDVAAAVHAVRAHPPPREVVLARGVHRLSEPIVLSHLDSGLTLRGEGGATLDGGVALTFAARSERLWAAPLPPALVASKGGLSTLYVNGERRLRARAPNAVGLPPWSFESLLGDDATFHIKRPIEPCSKPAFGVCPAIDTSAFIVDLDERGAPNASWVLGPEAFVAVAQAWLFDWAHVKSFNASSGRLDFVTPLRDAVGAYGSSRDSPSGGRWFLENVRAALDAEGEFFVDSDAGEVLYIPLPGETLASVNAVMPNLKSLWSAAGTPSTSVESVTLADVSLQHFGEGGVDARLGYWSYSAAATVGPYAKSIVLRNVSISKGVADGVGILDHVVGVTLERLTISDVGGKGVGSIGDLTKAVQTSSGFLLANSTISHVGMVFLAGACAVEPVGAGSRVFYNELYDTPYSGVALQEVGGPSRDAAPAVEIAYNLIHDLGAGVLSDLGGIYISSASDKKPATNWLSADVHHNSVTHVRTYPGGYGGNGLYTDHGTSGVHFFNNILADLGGRGGSLHCGRDIQFAGNLVYSISTQNFTSAADNNGALSSCNGNDVSDPGFRANVSNNIFFMLGTANAWAPQDTTWAPPAASVVSDRNVWWVGAGAPPVLFPPGNATLSQWRSVTGNDAHTVEADPLLRDPARGDFTVLQGSPAWALGWVALDSSTWGPLPL